MLAAGISDYLYKRAQTRGVQPLTFIAVQSLFYNVCVFALAAYYGASLLCYVTPAEHLGLPTEDEVREGVIAHRIAAHAADVARGLPGARRADDAMARARMKFDWTRQFALALDGRKARARYEQTRSAAPGQADHCSMCGRDFCAIRTTRRLHEKAKTR